jgi:hypothetical protein
MRTGWASRMRGISGWRFEKGFLSTSSARSSGKTDRYLRSGIPDAGYAFGAARGGPYFDASAAMTPSMADCFI